MKGTAEGLKTFAPIDALLHTNSPGMWIVADATWEIADYNAVDFAVHYSEADLLKLIDKLISTDQRCQQSHIDKLKEARQLKRGERIAIRRVASKSRGCS
jgi:hypothetical protein